jgi:Xaa-Pro aminopeptidase
LSFGRLPAIESKATRTQDQTTPPPNTELKTRRRAVQDRLEERGWTACLVTTEQNFVYLTGLRFDALWPSAARSLACVVPADGPLTLVIPDFLIADATESHPEAGIVGYDPPLETIDEPIARVLDGLSPGPIGLELAGESRFGTSLETSDSIRRRLTGREVVDVAGLLWEVRLRKSPSEIAALTAAAEAGARAFRAVFADGVAGRTERDIARALSAHALESGADRAEWVACTSGAGSYHRFVSAPRERVVEPGDMVWADIGLTSDGYWTDFCRAAVAGPVSPERSALQSVVIAATEAGIGRCLPGIPVAEVAAAVRRRASDLGVDLLGYGRLGHGIGLSSTEPPSIAEWDETVLAPGMVVTIEPAVSNASGIYCAEQVVVVTEDQPIVLTTAPSELTAT